MSDGIEKPSADSSLDHPATTPSAGEAPDQPQWKSEQLLAGGNEAFIIHENEVYRLRRTRRGKLILYK